MTAPTLCLSCQIAKGEVVPEGGAILKTERFNVHQDFEYPIVGMVIIASNRHVKCFDELSLDEATELATLVRKVRYAQRHALGIQTVYYFYNEDTKHHFHLWMVPRYPWMEKFGKSVQSLRPALEHARQNFTSNEDISSLRRAATAMRDSLLQQNES